MGTCFYREKEELGGAVITEESIGRAGGGGAKHGGFPLAELLQSLIGWAAGGVALEGSFLIPAG